MGAIAQGAGSSATPRARGWLRQRLGWLGTTLLLAPLLVALGGTFFVAPTDPDYWWHARTGQLISETGRLPKTDIYSFASADRPWITHEWLTELLLYQIEHQVGYVANVALFATLGMVTALLIYLHARRRGLGRFGAALAMLWGFAILLPLANVRPQMVTVCATAFCVLLLVAYRQGARRALWALPPFFAIWVNLHGGYVIGLALLALTLGGEALERALSPGQTRRAWLRALAPLGLTAVLAVLATLLNPHGLEALRYPLSYVGTGNVSQRYVAEWQSPNFHDGAFLPFAVALLLGIMVGIGRRPLGWPERLWVGVFALLGLQSIRHLPLFAVIATPILMGELAALSREWPGQAWWRPRWRIARQVGLSALALGALVLVMTIGTGPAMRAQLQLGTAPSATGYPAGALAYLRAHEGDPALHGRLFNEYRWAGYLIYYLYPERQVFVSAQATDPYGSDLFTPYRRTIQLAPGWRDTLDSWRIDLVLIDKDGPLAVMLQTDAGWHEVYAGEVERLFVRQGERR